MVDFSIEDNYWLNQDFDLVSSRARWGENKDKMLWSWLIMEHILILYS